MSSDAVGRSEVFQTHVPREPRWGKVSTTLQFLTGNLYAMAFASVKSRLRSLAPPWLYGAYAAFRHGVSCVFSLGMRYQCPFCKWRFRRWIPTGFTAAVLKERHVAGAGYRKNGLCPWCNSIDKERLVYLYLQNKTDLFETAGPALRLLHMAPEERLGKRIRALPRVRYVSGDITPGRAMQVVDLTKIAYPDASFDVIMCSHVLEHIPEDRKAMQELYRVLAPGGYAILQVPISLTRVETWEDPTIEDPAERERMFGQSDHVRIYGADYVTRLEGAGFSVERWSAVQEFGEEFARRYGLNPEEDVFICRKSVRSITDR